MTTPLITVTANRTRGSEKPFAPIICKKDVDAALYSLAKCELGFGGSVTDVTETKIVCVTRVLDCVDTTSFEGDKESMYLLVEMCLVYMELRSTTERVYPDHLVDRVMKITRGVPLLVKMGAGMIVGEHLVRLALIALIGDLTFVERARDMRIADLCAVLSLVRKCECSVDEAFALAA